MLILGLSPFRHHQSAALLQDGVLRAAIENEKLSRSNSPGLPNEAITFCLQSVGARWRDLDEVTIATRPMRAWLRRSWFQAKIAARAPLSAVYHEAKEVGNLARELKYVRILQQKDGTLRKVGHFDHHLCHASTAFFLSPFDQALVITLDEDGDGDSGTIALVRVTKSVCCRGSVSAIHWLASIPT